LLQFAAKPARIHADDGVCARIERRAALEYLHPDNIFFQGVLVAFQVVLDYVPQEAAGPRRPPEWLARDDFVELRPDQVRWNMSAMSGHLITVS